MVMHDSRRRECKASAIPPLLVSLDEFNTVSDVLKSMPNASSTLHQEGPAKSG